MIAIRLADCDARPYAEILSILHAPVTEEAAAVLRSILPDLQPPKVGREAYHAGGRFTVSGDLVRWYPVADRPAPPDLPSLLSRALHLAGTLGRVAGELAHGKNPMADADEIARRVTICTACPMLSSGACSRCGCDIERKATVLSEGCPDGKW